MQVHKTQPPLEALSCTSTECRRNSTTCMVEQDCKMKSRNWRQVQLQLNLSQTKSLVTEHTIFYVELQQSRLGSREGQSTHCSLSLLCFPSRKGMFCPSAAQAQSESPCWVKWVIAALFSRKICQMPPSSHHPWRWWEEGDPSISPSGPKWLLLVSLCFNLSAQF